MVDPQKQFRTLAAVVLTRQRLHFPGLDQCRRHPPSDVDARRS